MDQPTNRVEFTAESVKRLGLPAREAVYMVLSAGANHNPKSAGYGMCCIQHKRVARMLGLCRKTITRSVKRLVADGWIERYGILHHDGEKLQVYRLRIAEAGR